MVRLSLNANPERCMESFAGIDNTQLLATGERAGGGSHRLECDEVCALRREHLRVTVVTSINTWVRPGSVRLTHAPQHEVADHIQAETPHRSFHVPNLSGTRGVNQISSSAWDKILYNRPIL